MEEYGHSTEEAREMFNLYAELLNQEFHDRQNAKDAADECISIATTLLESGFIILTRFKITPETRHLSCDSVQTVLTFEYDLALFKHQIPIGQPMATAAATTKIFGPRAAADHLPPISKKDEIWLRSVLDSITANKPDTNPPPQEKD